MDESKNTIIAIDPGASGGIALMHKQTVQAGKMPKSIPELDEYFSFVKIHYPNITVFIEKVQAYSKGDDAPGKKFGINKMLANYNQLLTVIQLNGLKYVEVYPVSWQSTLCLRIKNTDNLEFSKFKTLRKNKYKEFAQKCFPELKVTLATSDALCLIKFATIKISADIEWIRKRLQNNNPIQTKIN